MRMTEPTPAGWYPDPGNSGQLRYWDGTAWTDNYSPVAGAATPSAATVPPKKPIYKRTWFIVLAVLFGCGVLGNMLSGTPSTPPEPDPTTQSTPAPTETAPEVAEPEPAPEPEPEPEKPAEPEMTLGQEQAVQSASSYLSMGGFSRKKLIDQLVFEDFSKADAEFAVDYLSPDWNEQAAQSAKSYIEMGGFSRQKLIEQLMFEGFTKAQAERGVKAAGY